MYNLCRKKQRHLNLNYKPNDILRAIESGGGRAADRLFGRSTWKHDTNAVHKQEIKLILIQSKHTH